MAGSVALVPSSLSPRRELAEICAQYLGKGQLVALEGRL
jgi:hypothetical protein